VEVEGSAAGTSPSSEALEGPNREGEPSDPAVGLDEQPANGAPTPSGEAVPSGDLGPPEDEPRSSVPGMTAIVVCHSSWLSLIFQYMGNNGKICGGSGAC
jgi:hypothetical protein